MIPYKNGFYYFDINDLDNYYNMNIRLFFNNKTLYNFNDTFMSALNIGKNMDTDIFFGRYSSTVEEEVLVFIFGFLKGIEENNKYKNYLYHRSLEYKEKCFNDFFSKCSISEK